MKTARRRFLKTSLASLAGFTLDGARLVSAQQPSGMGGRIAADLAIYWPSGAVEQYASVTCDRLVTIREGHGFVPNLGWAK